MKKFLLFLVISISAFNGSKAQTVGVYGNTIRFSDYASYESYADGIASRDNIDNVAKSSPAVETVLEKGTVTDDDLPLFLQSILNKDNIFAIGNYYARLDTGSHTAMVTNVNNPNAYADLVNKNTKAANMINMPEEETNPIEVLKAIDAGTLTISDYNNADETARIKWPWNQCKGAGSDPRRPKIIWKFIEQMVCKQDKQLDALTMDIKTVYQKYIFYFSLESKIQSRRGCAGSNWIGIPNYIADLKLDGRSRFAKVNDCKNYSSPTISLQTIGRELNWRPYEGLKALTHYDLTVNFGIRTLNTSDPYFSRTLNIND